MIFKITTQNKIKGKNNKKPFIEFLFGSIIQSYWSAENQIFLFKNIHFPALCIPQAGATALIPPPRETHMSQCVSRTQGLPQTNA
jgi:hypothetical protein